MSEVKMGSGRKIALIVVSTLFVISLIVNLYLYTRQYGGITPDNGDGLENQVINLQTQLNSLNTTYDDYVSTHSHSNSEYDTLQSEYDDYVSDHYYTNSEYNALKSERDSLKASKLVTNLESGDARPLFQTPYLHVYGDVWNVGTNTAYSCRLHVTLYQGEVVAEDTYINLGTIEGEHHATVDSKIYYSGEPLTHWSWSTEKA